MHTTSKSGKKSETTEHPIRILMMEDDQYYFRFVKRLLTQRSETGFDVAHVNSLSSCLEHLADDTPDVIIIDLCLPDSKGLTTLESVHRAASGAPIVVLTGSDDEQTGLTAVSMGAQDFLVKHQVSNDSLYRSIQYAIERRKAEEASLRMAAIQDFTSTLAQNLQVPLVAANSVLEALLTDEFGELPPNVVRPLKDLKENNNQQLQSVAKLLQVYQYETGQNHAFENIDLGAVLKAACASVEERFGKDKPIKVSISDGLPPVNGNESALSALFVNLVENAVKFGDPGKPITVTANLARGKLGVTVHNFGNPIPDEGQKQIFQKFWHGVPGKWYTPHTGIGLYLCNRITILHRGRITCVSKEDAGTTITVKLPAA